LKFSISIFVSKLSFKIFISIFEEFSITSNAHFKVKNKSSKSFLFKFFVSFFSFPNSVFKESIHIKVSFFINSLACSFLIQNLLAISIDNSSSKSFLSNTQVFILFFSIHIFFYSVNNFSLFYPKMYPLGQREYPQGEGFKPLGII
jgi:hypothetical protein